MTQGLIPAMKPDDTMRSPLAILKNVFTVTPLPPGPTKREKTRQESDRQIVARHSSGNVLLQQGKYATREELDAERERALAFR